MGRNRWPAAAAVVAGSLLVIVVGCLVVFPAWGGGYGWRMHQAPAPWASVGGWDMMGMMLIWPVLLLVLGAPLVAGVVWAVQLSSRAGSQPTGPRAAGEAPSEILRRRYAAGEITKEQFDEMRRTLEAT